MAGHGKAEEPGSRWAPKSQGPQRRWEDGGCVERLCPGPHGPPPQSMARLSDRASIVICAYRDGEGDATREHVWPSCFLEREGREAAHFSHQSGRVHGGDYVIKDVCRECNGTRLSPLDAYFCQLYDEYFGELHDFDSVVTFRFDHDRLLRSLLKIAFNSARSVGSDIEPFQRHRRYILGMEDMKPGVALFAELVSPSMVEKAGVSGEQEEVLPLMYRSAVTGLLTPAGQQVVTRIVAVRSFYFHLVLQPPGVGSDVFHEAADDLGRLIQGVVRIDPGAEQVVLSSSPQDGLRSMAPFLQAHREQYQDFFDRQREARHTTQDDPA